MRAAQQRDDARDPDRRHQRQEHRLERQELDPGVGPLRLGDDRGHLQLRPAVEGLVEQVRGADEERQADARPQVPRPQDAPRADHQERDGEADQEQHHQVLVVQADADRRPGREPPARVRAAQRAGGEQQHRGPHRDVDGGRGEHVPHGDRDAREGQAGGAHGLRAGPAAELAGDEDGQPQRREHAQHRRNPEGPQGVAEDGDGRLRQQRGERRLVHIAPGGFEHPEVQLVAVVVVPGGGRGVHRGQDEGGDGQRRARHARQRLGGAFGHVGLRFWSAVTSGGRRRGGAASIIPRLDRKRKPAPMRTSPRTRKGRGRSARGPRPTGARRQPAFTVRRLGLPSKAAPDWSGAPSGVTSS